MRKIDESNGESIVQMTAQEKRVLITKAVADVHERLAKKVLFEGPSSPLGLSCLQMNFQDFRLVCKV